MVKSFYKCRMELSHHKVFAKSVWREAKEYGMRTNVGGLNSEMLFNLPGEDVET